MSRHSRGPIGGERDFAGALGDLVGRHRVIDLADPILFQAEAVSVVGLACEEVNFHDANDLGLRSCADQTDGEFAAGKERLHDHGLMERGDQFARRSLESLNIANLGIRAAALAGAFGEWLDESRPAEIDGTCLLRGV